MRLLRITGILILGCAASIMLYSCKTQPPVTEKPGEATVQKPEESKKFTRIAFAEKLEKLLGEGKTEEALGLFATVPEPDASSLSIQLLKLSLMISANKMEESMALANQIETANPENPDILYIQAVLAGAKNDNPSRTKYLNKVLAVQPKNSQAMTALGLDFFAKRNYPMAKTWFLKSLSADPDNIDTLLGLARVYYMQNELVKASDTLNLAIEKNAEYSLLWAERARIKSESRDLQGALADIEKAVALDADIYSQWIDYGTYLISSAKKENARKAFTEAVRISPEEYLAYIYRAGLNDDLGYTDEAIYDYSAICRLYPDYFYAFESLGILLWGKGDYAGSRTAFTEALKYNPKNVSYGLMVTLCYYRENKLAEAKSFMTKYAATLDKTTTEYFVCRMFAERTGDADVLKKIMKVDDLNVRNRMLFYAAMYFELFQSKTIAQKYYLEVISIPAPSFFEYRLSQWAIKELERSGENSAT